MAEFENPMFRFAGVLTDLAEGRLAPTAWVVWWGAHAHEVEAACLQLSKPGWALKLKPTGATLGDNGVALISQRGACEILGFLNLPFVRSDRYQKHWQEDFAKFRAAEDAGKQARANQMGPRISALAEAFPKFARFLKKRIDKIDRLEEPATLQELAALEESLGVPLPSSFKRFLECTKSMSLDGFSIGVGSVCEHIAAVDGQSQPGKSICIAEYWLEADGDQVLLEHTPAPADDPPVFYYAHEARKSAARKLAPSFSAWIESLSRSPVFRR